MQAFSRLGFGVTGPHATPLVDPQTTIDLVKLALERGISLFDTGPMYGNGEGERRLGAAIKGTPADKLFVITKARTRTKEGARQSLRQSLEQSLDRLGQSRVNALLLHGPSASDLDDDAIHQELRGIQSERLADVIGLCGRGAEVAFLLNSEKCLALFTLLMSPVEDLELLNKAEARGVPVIGIETMRSTRTAIRFPKSKADLWYLARTARDAALGRRQGAGIGVDAALARPAVASVIVTTTRASHLDENIRAAKAVL